MDFSTEFLQGQQDCIDDVVHVSKNDAYDRGYACQYEIEQVLTELSLRSK
jgi:hypothetical protein